ncbi:MAG: PIG-L deacetylase family protein [Paracoccaceae bacterium]
MTRRALFLSPHLDDAAFSAGGLVIALARAGWEVTLATVFTRSVEHPTGFALECQTSKGIAPEVDYMALRRAEDRAACDALGARPLYMDYPEAPHRGYDSPDALFGERVDGDDAAETLAPAFARLVDRLGPDLVALPEGLGDHVDHRAVVEGWTGAERGTAVVRWRDLPYAARLDRLAPAEACFLIDLPGKLGACAAYDSQLYTQFGGEGGMRRLLTAFAFGEGAGRTAAEGVSGEGAGLLAGVLTALEGRGEGAGRDDEAVEPSCGVAAQDGLAGHKPLTGAPS